MAYMVEIKVVGKIDSIYKNIPHFIIWCFIYSDSLYEYVLSKILHF